MLRLLPLYRKGAGAKLHISFTVARPSFSCHSCGSPMCLRHGLQTRAFVPIELLAIVASTLWLAGIVLPAIARSSTTARATRCLNNHKQLAHAWQLYALENDGQCVNNYTIPDTMLVMQNGTFENWVNNIMTWGATSFEDSSVTNRAWAAKGRLHPYTDGDILVHKCPADNFLSPVQRQRKFDLRLRSVAMNSLVGQNFRPPRLDGRSWGSGGTYRQWLKLPEIPQPAKTWVTIDEHPDSINDGFFIIEPGSTIWADTPGTFHRNATPFSFADAHVELRKWRSTAAQMPVRYRWDFPRTIGAAGRADFAWYLDHTGLVRY